ncbi:hypothetical protein XENORESO_015668, partial [Xenotaenia resolanae]
HEVTAAARANLVIKDQEDPQVCQVLQVQRDPEVTEVNEDQRGCRGFLDVRGTQDELEFQEMMDVLVLMDRRANLETRVHRGHQENRDQRGRRGMEGEMVLDSKDLKE